MKLTLILTIEYTPNGTTAEELMANLREGAEYLADIGKFTQDTEAEVEMWDEQVVKGVPVITSFSNE